MVAAHQCGRLEAPDRAERFLAGLGMELGGIAMTAVIQRCDRHFTAAAEQRTAGGNPDDMLAVGVVKAVAVDDTRHQWRRPTRISQSQWKGAGKRTLRNRDHLGACHLRDQLVRTADTIIVPVLPSPIDIDAVLSLVEALRRVETVCKYGVRIAAVVNRVPAYRSGLKPLEMALETVGLSVATRLRETRRYPRASARGIGVNELGGIGRERCLDDWRPLWAWLEHGKGHEALTPEHQTRPRLFPDRVAAPA